jgi:hypothetical protein
VKLPFILLRRRNIVSGTTGLTHTTGLISSTVRPAKTEEFQSSV